VKNTDEKVRLLESVVLNATDAVLITSAEPVDYPGPVIIYVNPAFSRMTGYAPEEVLGKSPRLLQGPNSCVHTRERIRAALKAWKPVEAELLNYKKDGSTFWVELSLSLVTDETGWHTHWISIQRDVTERREKQEALRQLELTSLRNQALSEEIRERELVQEQLNYVAFHDSLTGLHNRAFFIDALRKALLQVQQSPSRGVCVVLYLDLDGFKGINDTLGHRIGDELLIETGHRLRSCARASDTLARIGGDEFTFLFEGLVDFDEGQEIAERILEATQAQVTLASTVLQMAPSIGICRVNADHVDAESILRDADLAMYSAKRAGGGRWAVFGQNMHEEALTKLQRKIQLRAALEHNEFELYYQSLVKLKEQRVYGVEALLRWNHPSRGRLNPDEFIGLAEEMGLIVPMGRWALRQACSDLQTMKLAHGDNLCLSVNVSPRQLEETGFLDDLASVLRETQIDPKELQLEITESIFLQDAQRIGNIFQEIRSQGVSIGFDDFGTGYSSLGYLEQYPIDTLKIDQSFVHNMSANHTRASIVRMIVQLAQEIGITVSAEGVETAEQASLLRACGCNLVQGYLYGKPVPLPEMLKRLREGVRYG
jgi:diguanylate cyclase (GGDEF)-like protein/PAS domain S-box-containing protein